MKKNEYIKKYGEEAFEKRRIQTKEWDASHLLSHREYDKKWRETHPERVREHYKRVMEHQRKGIPHAKYLIRQHHRQMWRRFKQIIAPNSQIHHEWLPSTADYRGVALVETNQHMHGFIDVIQILEGEITLLTERTIREREIAV